MARFNVGEAVTVHHCDATALNKVTKHSEATYDAWEHDNIKENMENQRTKE